MSEGVPYIRFYGDDWLSGTQDLSLEECGALIKIVAITSTTGRPPKADFKRLGRRLGCTAAKARKLVKSLEEQGKIYIEDDGIVSPRALEETRISSKFCKKQSENVCSRWAKSERKTNENNGSVDTTVLPRYYHPEPEPYNEDDDTHARALYRIHMAVLEAVGVTSEEEADAYWLAPQQVDQTRIWVDELGLSCDDILDEIGKVLSRKGDGPPHRLAYFTPAMRHRARFRSSPSLTVVADNTRPSRKPRSGYRRLGKEELLAGMKRLDEEERREHQG